MANFGYAGLGSCRALPFSTPLTLIVCGVCFLTGGGGGGVSDSTIACLAKPLVGSRSVEGLPLGNGGSLTVGPTTESERAGGIGAASTEIFSGIFFGSLAESKRIGRVD